MKPEAVFERDLDWSLAQGRAPWVTRAYLWFYSELGHIAETCLTMQRLQADKEVSWLSCCGREREYCEEKFSKYRPDAVFLEFVSNDKTKAKGWMEKKEVRSKWLFYGFVNQRVAFFIDFADLRRAWKQHKREWIEQFGAKKVRNRGYNTIGVVVPLDVVLPLVRYCKYVD